MGSTSKPKKAKATDAEKAAKFEASNMWKDVKERFWPLDDKIAGEVQNVGRGRVAREEGAVGAMPLAFNPQRPGDITSQSLGLAGEAANRQVGLRTNEADRLNAGTANLVATGRGIQTSALQDTTAMGRVDTSRMLGRYNAKQAVNQGIINGVSQLGATAATAYALKSPTQRAPAVGLQSNGVYQSGTGYINNTRTPTGRR